MHAALPAIFITLLLISAAPASAAQAYTWTDAAGVTHFSESVPANVANEAAQVELPAAPVTPSLAPDRYRSINEQAARLQADRLKRAQLREKRRQIEAKRRADRERAQYREQEYSTNTYPYYAYPYWYRPYPHHHRPFPRHRQAPPPPPRFQPGKTITQQRNQEALRNQRYHW